MYKIVFTTVLLFGYCLAKEASTNIKDICSSCHGVWMQEGGIGVSRAPNSLPHKDILGKLRAYQEGELNQYGRGRTMQEQLKNLSDKELMDLSEYIPTLKK